MNKEDLREHYRHVAILRLLLASSYLLFRGSSSADMRSTLLDILDTTTRSKLMNHFNASQYLIFLYTCHSCAIICQQILIYETEGRQAYLRSDASSTLYSNDSPPITHPRNSNAILHAAIRPPCQISAMSQALRVLTVRVRVDVERRVNRMDLRGGVWRWEGGSGADAT